MNEKGIDIRHHRPTHINRYLHEDWDCVITVCGGAHEYCPVFDGTVTPLLHYGFADPSQEQGTSEHIIHSFYQIRDAIQSAFFTLYREQLRPCMSQ